MYSIFNDVKATYLCIFILLTIKYIFVKWQFWTCIFKGSQKVNVPLQQLTLTHMPDNFHILFSLKSLACLYTFGWFEKKYLSENLHSLNCKIDKPKIEDITCNDICFFRSRKYQRRKANNNRKINFRNL